MTIWKGILSAFGMIVLILDSRCALAGATEGITLCLQTVLPTLFPFFVLSTMLTAAVPSPPHWLSRLLRISPNASGPLLAGLLGGYPIGAKAVSQAYVDNQLSKEEAQRLLPVCNQCGPSFLFGTCAAVLGDIRQCLLLWGIMIISAMITARVIYAGAETIQISPVRRSITLSEAVRQAVSSMAIVCGWIILFRIFYRFMNRWMLWRFSIDIQIAIAGLLELANGCADLWQASTPSQAFLICGMVTSFGGLCVTLQTLSVVHPDINRRYYFPGKVLQCSLCVIITSFLQGQIGKITWIFAGIGGLCVIILKKGKKTVAFSQTAVYNSSIKNARI